MAEGGPDSSAPSVSATQDGLPDAAQDPSVRYLLDRIGIIEARVHAEVERRRAAAVPVADERFLGLYVSEHRVDELLSAGPPQPVPPDADSAAWLTEIEAEANALAADGAAPRLRRLADGFELDHLDVELLLVALAPDIDSRFEPLYGYLNDDVSQRRATIGLALQLCGVSVASGRARSRLDAGSPLRAGGLLVVEADDRPVLSRTLRVPDRVIGHLLGIDSPDPLLSGVVRDIVPMPGLVAEQIASAVLGGSSLVYVRDHRGADAAASAAAGLAAVGHNALAVDVTRATPDTDLLAIATTAERDARLCGGALIVGPIDEVASGDRPAVHAFAAAGVPVVLYGTGAWDPAWSRTVPTILVAEPITPAAQQQAWNEVLDGSIAPGVDPAALTSPFRMNLEQINRAARSAQLQAALDARMVETEDLQRGARSQNAAGLQRLARRIEPAARWNDLVLPRSVTSELQQLTARWRHRDLVLGEWGLSGGAARGRGVSALFAGASGTGKTLASEVIAAELGLDLYVVDLSTVVDKYIGETSKNLERIFDEADRVNGVLLFDEADALFGKRSAVSDAKDRHANVEVAFLLQRMETFDGVVILTTNLAANLDAAFMRRLDAIVDFPSPDESQRRRLWQAKLRVELPLADDIDIDVLADRFRLSGSEIRNVVLTAAYGAAAEKRAISMDDLVRAVVREHRKIGRHLSRADLGEFAELADDRG